MAKDKKSFLLYCDQKELFTDLPDDIAGKLIKHIFMYVNDEDPETSDLLLKTAFNPIKQQLKRDLKKYESIKEKRSEAGKKSAEARKNKSEQTSTNSTSVKSVQQTSTNSTVKENVNVNVNDTVKEKEIFIKEILKSENQKISTIKSLKATGLIVQDYDSEVEKFVLKLIADDDIYKNATEIKKHFNNWLRLEVKNKDDNKSESADESRNELLKYVKK